MLFNEKESHLKCEKTNKELTEKLEKAEKDIKTYRYATAVIIFDYNYFRFHLDRVMGGW